MNHIDKILFRGEELAINHIKMYIEQMEELNKEKVLEILEHVREKARASYNNE
jgi:hypothetical protein